ncbi:MAG: UDP-N-acetylglucosamine 1-carboxyvinyltransferase [Clostridia bacterium]|nr:UDP-N-acetylglucosamine 1-carboxyvinyltransferase [Clostridia bacterium]
MEKIIVNGPCRLEGEVTISGAKNAAVAILPATLLVAGKCHLENVPNISDIRAFVKILESLGSKIEYVSEHEMIIDNTNIHTTVAPYDLTSKFRASYYLLGALLSRFGNAQISLPGGCNIGARPIDQHIKAFETLGAEVEVKRGNVYATSKKLEASSIFFDVVTVGGTINAILAATLVPGTTTIENCAKEPHIVDVANFLNSVGASIKGAGTDVIKVTGVKSLKQTSSYAIIPDQIEAGTFMVAAAATKGDVLIKNCIPKHMEPISAKLEESGAEVIEYEDSIRVRMNKSPKAINIKTLPYPGFPTDMQPQFGTYLTLATGSSMIVESIWESRFQYTAELVKMGATISYHDRTAMFTGVKELYGSPVKAMDLRAGAAMIIAGLTAHGATEIYDIHHIERGYENIVDKFKALGANIEYEITND